MTDITYVQQLGKTISGEFYFGAMCRETKRRIAISTDTSRGKQRYSQSGETIVSCNHCHKTHRFDNRDIFSFPHPPGRPSVGALVGGTTGSARALDSRRVAYPPAPRKPTHPARDPGPISVPGSSLYGLVVPDVSGD